VREVFEAALALPDEERARLRDELDASLAEAEAGARLAADKGLLANIRQREEAFRNGAPGIPADDVFDELLSE